MKNTFTLILICFFSIGIVKISDGQELTIQQKSKIENQVDSIFHLMIKSAEKMDYDKLSRGVDDRYRAGFIVGDSYYTRYDSLIFFLKSRSQGVAGQNITLTKEKVTALSENIVLLTASGIASIDVNGGNIVNRNFNWSFVYVNISNKWQVVQSHQSSYR